MFNSIFIYHFLILSTNNNNNNNNNQLKYLNIRITIKITQINPIILSMCKFSIHLALLQR